jgi:predicted MFS family arabinose efflux permease
VWVGTAVSRVPAGILLTRVSRLRVLVGTGLMLSAGAALAATAPSMRVLQVAALSVGLASGAYFVAGVPLLSELYPEAVGRAVGLHGMAAQVAAVVAPALAVGVLAVASWRAVFWLLAGAAVVATVAVWLVGRDGATRGTSAVGDRDFLAALAHWRVLVAAVTMIAVAGFVWQGLFNFYVSFMLSKGLSTSLAGTMLTVVFGAGVPAFVLSGRLADRLPHVPYIIAIHVAFTVCLVALTVAESVLALAVVSAATGYAIHSLFPAMDAYLFGRLPDADRASAYAVFSGGALALEATGSGVVGVLTEAGFAFATVFRWFAAGLAVLVVGLLVARAAGWLE